MLQKRIELKCRFGIMKELIDFKCRFGKYKGKLISWIVQTDPNYAKWLATKSNSQTKTKRATQSQLDKIKNETI